MTTIQRVWRFKERIIEPKAIKCRKCGFISYPPKAACPRCGSREIEFIKLPRKGKIITFTVLRVPLRGFEDRVPLVIALVDLGGARVLTEIIDIKPDEVEVGMEVEAVIDRGAKTIDGATPYVIKFRPIERESSSD